MRPHASRWLRPALIVGGIIIVGLAVPAFVDAAGVVGEMRQGRAAFSRLVHGSLSANDGLHARAAAGARRFAAAETRASRSRWLGVWAHVPVVGRPARWLREATRASASFSREAARSIGRIEPLLSRGNQDPGARVELLERVEAELGRLRRRTEAIHVGGTGWFLPPVNSANREFAAELRRVRTTLRNGEVAARALRGFFGGPRTYLMLAANNSEMRSGGMVLQAGLLRTNDGRVAAGAFVETSDLLLADAVPVPPDVQALYGWLDPGKDWRNLGTSPNFPAVAPVYAALAKAKPGVEVDGVIQMDVVAMRYFLSVVGPVEFDGQQYDAGNVEELVLHDLYDQYRGAQLKRRRDLSKLAAVVFDAVTHRSWDASTMGRALHDAAVGRHIMVWSKRAEEQAGWAGLGVEGSLDEDGVMVTIQNHTGNKLDWFLKPSVEVSVAPALGGQRRVRLKVRIENPVPAGEPPYVTGNGTFAPPGVYRAFVSVYVPGWAREVRILDRKALIAGPDGPMRVVGTRFDISPQGSEGITVEFLVPPGRRALVLLPSSRARPIPFHVGKRSLDDAVPHRIDV